MNKDFRIAVGFIDHPKTKKLIRACGDVGLVCYIRLLGFVAQNKWTGELAGMTEDDIEIAAGWSGEPGAFLAALVSVRFLDETGGQYSVHDWTEHNGFAATFGTRQEKAKEAVNKRWRDTKKIPKSNSSNTKTDSEYYQNDDLVLLKPKSSNTPSPSPSPTPSPEEEEITATTRARVEPETPKNAPNSASVQSETETGPDMGRGEAAALLAKFKPVFEAIWPGVQTVIISDQMITHAQEMAGRFPEFRTLEAWERAAERAKASPLLRGEKPGSKGRYFPGMTLAWFLKPDNLAHILNGVYDERPAPKGPAPLDAENYNPVSKLAEARQ